MTYRTIREEFEIAKAGMLKQMKKSQIQKSVGSSPFCAYRGEGGMCCGVGFLVSDSVAKALDIDSTVPDEDTFYTIATNLNPARRGFYGDIQDIHDNNIIEDWEMMLDYVEMQLPDYEKEEDLCLPTS